jgi:ankyrin repeat protein
MPPKKPTKAALFQMLINGCEQGNLAKVTDAVTAGADVNKKDPDNESPLFIAVKKNKKEIVEYLLSNGAKVDDINGALGSTALYQSCLDGTLDITKVLVDAGATINFKSPSGTSPFYNAIFNKHLPVIEYLISKGVNVDEKIGKNEHTGLFKACEDGSLDIAKVLVDAGANINFKSKERYTPLFFAVQYNRKPIVEYLVSKGVKIDEKNGQLEHTAMIKACEDGSLDIVKVLVDAGANINLKSKGEFSPLLYAVENKRKPIVEYLVSKGVNIDEKNGHLGNTALIKACEFGSLDIAKVLVDAGANINLKSKAGFTPLFYAVQKNHKPVVEYLISKGVNVDEKNGQEGSSALYQASYDGLLEIVTMLVDAGADVHLKPTHGYSILYAAFQNNHKPIMEYLISKGARVDEKNGPIEITVLYQACTESSLDIITLFVDAGADVNSKTKAGYTPLFLAVQNKRKPIVEYLISKGARINEKNGLNDDSALHKACYSGSLEMTKTLVEAGADINILDKIGQKPIDLAIGQNHQAVVEYLEALQPQPQWKGFTQSDISKFDTIFETEGEVPPAANYACCPVCLKFVERSDACMYMSHKCSGYYHKELHKKYANPEGLIYWCTICGRICFGHRHYEKTSWDSRKPELLPSGAPFDGDCKKTNGGGGLEEKLARFRALRNTAYDLQAALDAGETLTVKQATNELVQQCWNAAPGFITRRIMTRKAWNRPLSNFPPNVPPGAGEAQAVEYPKNDPSAYEAPRVLTPGNANFKPNSLSGADDEPVIQFKHKKADGSMNAQHFITKEMLLLFMQSSITDGWKCFEPNCDGHLWPGEVIQALENPALAATAEEKAKGQAYKELIHGPQQTAGRRNRWQKTQRRRHR